MYAYGIVFEREPYSFRLKNLFPWIYVTNVNCSEPIKDGDIVLIAFDFDDIDMETEIVEEGNYENHEVSRHVEVANEHIRPKKIRKITPQEFEFLQGLE